MKIVFYIAAFILCNNSIAQKIIPKYTFNIELGLPVSIANEPFDQVMQGLVAVSSYGQYTTPFNLNFGIGGRYSLFTINQFKVPVPLDGSVHTAAGFIKVGYDKFLTDRFAIDFGVKVGYSYNASSVKELNPEGEVIDRYYRNNTAAIIEPGLGLILSADEKSSYRFYIGYTIQGYGFKPDFIGLETNAGWDPGGFNKLTQYLIVGFGYTFYFKNNRQ